VAYARKTQKSIVSHWDLVAALLTPSAPPSQSQKSALRASPQSSKREILFFSSWFPHPTSGCSVWTTSFFVIQFADRSQARLMLEGALTLRRFLAVPMNDAKTEGTLIMFSFYFETQSRCLEQHRERLLLCHSD
jgi:hypothetical protein